jgi:hypothetical protein
VWDQEGINSFFIILYLRV